MEAVSRVGEFAHRLSEARGGTPELATAASDAERQVREALDDDLNAPEAVGALFSFIQRANAELDRNGSDVEALEKARAAFRLMDDVLDIQPRAIRFVVTPGGATPAPHAVPDLSDEERQHVHWAVSQLMERARARQAKDFARADALRKEVEDRGFLVKDTGQGTVLERFH
jgi:cysteinyl-tRNA synthetase